MDSFLRIFAECRDGLHAVSASAAGLPISLFVVGLAGSVTHCAGMCGPFVLSQVMADAGQAGQGGYGEWQRLRGAALLPYQLGRLTTYTLLGAVAGGATAIFATSGSFNLLAGVLLLVAAAVMATQAFGLAFGALPVAGGLSRLAAPLVASNAPGARFVLGILLGFLPCGLLYGAIAAAAGSGSVATGALTMAAFALGTIPMLVLVGWLGMLARRRLSGVARWVAAPVLALNAALMAALAFQRF
jgi:hypothetical protein